MTKRHWFIVVLLMLLGGGIVTSLGDMDEDVSLTAVLEIWGDVLRDVDQFGLRLTRMSDSEEMELGKEISRTSGSWWDSRSKRSEYVTEVGKTLLPYVQRKGILYTFKVVQMSQVNAFALPGGHVFVTTGMLKFLKSEAELAAILGHEISHVDLRHCIERFQYERALAKVGVEKLGKIADATRRFIAIGYNKYQELEADAQGVRLSIEAGYSPHAGATVFKRLQQHYGETSKKEAGTVIGEIGQVVGGALGSYLHSHPASETRVKRLNELTEKNKRRFREKKFYVGLTNFKDRVARKVDDRPDEWHASRSFLNELAEQGNKEAAIKLAKRFKDTEPLQKIAEQGDRDLALLLARDFNVETRLLRTLAEQGDRELVLLFARDFNVETRLLRTLAEQGDKEAAIELAKRFDDIRPLMKIAEQGDLQGDRELVLLLARDFKVETRLLRILAEQGDKEVAIELAKRFNEREPLKKIAEQGDRDLVLLLARDFNVETRMLRTLAEQGDKEAAIELAKRFDDIRPLMKIAEQGDLQGDRELVLLLARDFKVETRLLRILAEQGDKEAAIELAQNFDEPEPLWALVQSGENVKAEVAFEIYEHAVKSERPKTEVLGWLCEAANAWHAKARMKLAQLHRPWNDAEYTLQPNNRVAYMWYTLAAEGGLDTFGSRGIVAEEMTVQEIAQAEQMTRDWKPGQCPAP